MTDTDKTKGFWIFRVVGILFILLLGFFGALGGMDLGRWLLAHEISVPLTSLGFAGCGFLLGMAPSAIFFAFWVYAICSEREPKTREDARVNCSVVIESESRLKNDALFLSPADDDVTVNSHVSKSSDKILYKNIT